MQGSQEEVSMWKCIFERCYGRLSDQRLPFLEASFFEYIMSDDPNKTVFYSNHQRELDAFEIFRRCFRRNMLLYDQHELNNSSLISDLIVAESNSMLKNMAESWIPGLRLSVLDNLSGEVYENAHTSGQTIVFFPDRNEAPIITAFHQNNHLPLESNSGHAVRKQMSTCGEESALAVAWENGEYRTQGLASIRTQRIYPSIRFVKHLHWELHLPAKEGAVKDSEQGTIQETEQSGTRCIVRFFKGSLRFPLVDAFEEYRMTVERIFGNDRIAMDIATLLKNVNAKKGTSLVFSDSEMIQCERNRLARDNRRGVPFPENIQYALIKNGAVQKDLLTQLCNIDGALLIDTSCYCYAFGVILDGIAVVGNPNRGARYNSMLSYKNALSVQHPGKPFLCAVFSEDGMIDLFSEQ